MVKFLKQADYMDNPPAPPLPDPYSETIPDQSMSIREILQRSIVGSMPAIQKQAFYQSDFGEVGYDDFDPTSDPSFDIVDADQMLSAIQESQKQSDQKEEERSGFDDVERALGSSEPEASSDPES